MTLSGTHSMVGPLPGRFFTHFQAFGPWDELVQPGTAWYIAGTESESFSDSVPVVYHPWLSFVCLVSLLFSLFFIIFHHFSSFLRGGSWYKLVQHGTSLVHTEEAFLILYQRCTTLSHFVSGG